MFFTKHHNKRRGMARTGRLTLAAVAALGALAFAPGAADAGTYHMYNCHVAGHETGNHGPWTYSTAYGAPGTTFYSACGGAGGSAGYEFGPYAAGYLGANSRVDLTLSKDNSNISISGMKLWFTALSATAPGYPAIPITATVWKDGTKWVEWSGGPTASYASSPLELAPTQTVTLSLACGAGGPCMPNGGFPLMVNGAQTDLVENVSPGAAIAGGTLVAAGAQTGTKTVTVQGTDPDSGVRKLEALLDDHVVASVDYDRDWSRPLSEQKAGTCAYESWRACDAAQTSDLSVNTKLLPDGTYGLTARVTDAAGNVTTTSPQAVSIDNVADPVPPAPPVAGPRGDNGPNGATGATGTPGVTTVLTRNGSNSSPQAAFRGRFVGYSSTAIRAPYGKTVQMAGQLLAPGGAPIAGAKIAVLRRDKVVGATFVPEGQVVTDAQGRFAYTTVATRSRTIRFGYRTNLEDVEFARTIDFGLGVIPRITLKTNKRSLRNGQAVRFSGVIAGAPTNVKKVVELQVRKGKGWMTFTTTRLKNGRFSYAYRFKRTRGRVTYVFRARVREEAGFPFLSGQSKSVKVAVRG